MPRSFCTHRCWSSTWASWTPCGRGGEKRLPVVLSAEEVQRVLQHVEGADGVFRMIARLLYGAGLRLMECCRLRVKDVDLQRGQILARGETSVSVHFPSARNDELTPSIPEMMN